MKIKENLEWKSLSLQATELVKEIKSLNQELDSLTNKRIESLPPEKSKTSPNLQDNLALVPYSPQPLDIIVIAPITTKDRISSASPENAVFYTIKKRSYNWKSFSSTAHYTILGPKELQKELETFLFYYKKEYPKHKFFAIIFKIRFRNGSIRSCSSVQVSTVYDLKKLFSIFSLIFYLEDFADKVSEDEREIFEDINSLPSGKILFDFKPMITVEGTKYEGLASIDEKKKKIHHIRLEKDYKHFDFKGVKIPSHMDLWEWPNIEFSKSYNSATAYYIQSNKENQKYIFNIELENDRLNVTVKDSHFTTLFSFTDTLNRRGGSTDLTSFTRVITENTKQKIYIFKGGKVLLFVEQKSTKTIEPISSSTFFRYDNVRTLDLETRTVDGKMIPICMTFYDARKKNGFNSSESFLFKDHLNWPRDMENALKKSIMKRAHKDTIIYVHNFSYFDAIFMMDILSKLGTVKPLIRDNRIIKLNFSFYVTNEKTGKVSDKPYTLTFYDSYLLLPASLNSLGKSFNIENKKSIFPFSFINQKEISLDYSGRVPEYKYFPKAYSNDFTLEDYTTYCEHYKNKKWNLSRELVYYCERDTIALHQILLKFGQEIFKMYKIDIIKYPTLPSLAFAIYRSKFMPKDKIPLILSKLHFTLKESYYGGITDIYKPLGRKIHSYDVNSLYPSSMLKYPMPVGKPTFFSGNPYLLNKDPFGFFKVKISSPLDLKVPILPTKVETKSGIRTICSIGSWTGWYFSEEIKNAEKYGYKFEILEGYLFERDFIFTEYINNLYELKTSVEDNDPKYFIAKLLMNSLYGRFGMNPISEESRIVSAEESERIIIERKNVKVVPLLSGNCFISFDKLDEDELDITNISVVISSAIASYSRIQMSYFMNKYQNNLYAIDTDGIKVDCKLATSEVDNKQLGKMKYEYTFKEAVFVAPKVYGGLLEHQYKKYKTELTKVKGLKDKISYWELKSVLNKNNPLKLIQEKWKRRLGESTILVDLETYTLSITLNKRVIVYNSWGDFIENLPIRLEKGKIISPPFITRHSLPFPTWFILDIPLLAAPFMKERICLKFFQVLTMINYTKPQPVIPYIIFIIPLHIVPFHIRPFNVIPFIIYITPLNLLVYIIFIIPLYLTLYIIYITPLHIVPFIPKTLTIIPFIIYIIPLHILPFINKPLSIIPFMIYIMPLHLVPTIFLYESSFAASKEVDYTPPLKKRPHGRPRKIDFFILPDGVVYLSRGDLPKRPRGRPRKTVLPCLVGKREPP